MPILALKGISKAFGTHRVLHEVTLEIEAGEVVAIIGASGSGKSTLLRCINGLETPDSGVVEFDGKRCGYTRSDLNALHRAIGIVFQSYNLFPHLSVERNVTLGPTAAKGMPLHEAKLLAREAVA